jgi:hypothetical protein
MRIEDLFIGPLGRAQIGAMKFANGMVQAEAILEIFAKVEALDKLLENEKLEEIERKIAVQLKEELYNSVIAITEGAIVENGKTNKEKVF